MLYGTQLMTVGRIETKEGVAAFIVLIVKNRSHGRHLRLVALRLVVESLLRSALTDIDLKTVLNWANVSSRTELEVFGEASWFLIGPTFLREPSWKYSSKLYSGSKNLSLNMFWEHSPYWTIIASDWLRAELSCE